MNEVGKIYFKQIAPYYNLPFWKPKWNDKPEVIIFSIFLTSSVKIVS